MEENEEDKDIMEKAEEDSNPHFVKIIDYAKGQDWRTDLIAGLKGAPAHGHIALSGSSFWYIEDEQGNVIVRDGKVVEHTSKKE